MIGQKVIVQEGQYKGQEGIILEKAGLQYHVELNNGVKKWFFGGAIKLSIIAKRELY